jgi:hypothetical protein
MVASCGGPELLSCGAISDNTFGAGEFLAAGFGPRGNQSVAAFTSTGLS